jgi:2-oxoglutarate ferredoxin oxidoreductase subunit alpha
MMASFGNQSTNADWLDSLPLSGLGKVNEFAIKFANVNGTGSASANNLVLKAIFRMGVPVSGKNLFPSNIQGLPTWFEIRVSESGFTARSSSPDIVVAMNPQTYRDDIVSIKPGGALLYDSSWPLSSDFERSDVLNVGVPLSRLCSEKFPDPRQRVLLRNVSYVGAVSGLIDLDYQILSELLNETFHSNPKLQKSNQIALEIGYQYVKESYVTPLPIRLEVRDLNAGKILIDGNTAISLGCVYAGATVAAWYPITPATSVSENFESLCERLRTVELSNPDGTVSNVKNFAVLQAEDEMAALGMVIGASWAGARAFTSTSGPGISLMNELLGLGYYAEIPAVIFDIQRTGPSTGMPTRVQQSDILLSAYASHGDTKHILLFPGNPNECFQFAVKAFDLADHFQTPVIVLSDLDIGMNDWVADEFTWDANYEWDRGRILGQEELSKIAKFQRYSDQDEEYVTSRTLPGKDSKGAFFTRGSGHDQFGNYTESPEDYIKVMERLLNKHKASVNWIPEPIVRIRDKAAIGVITIGSCEPAVLEALDHFEKDGIEMDYLRIRGFPFHQSVKSFIEDHEQTLVVEQNRDAQLRSLLILELGIDPNLLMSVLSYGGFPLTSDDVLTRAKRILKGWDRCPR